MGKSEFLVQVFSEKAQLVQSMFTFAREETPF